MIAILLASARSGTHYLRSAVESSSLVVAPGELCNAEAERLEHTELSFFNFKAMQISAEHDLRLPTSDNQYKLLSRFFAFIEVYRKEINKEAIICDVKYSHLHNFNCFWWDLFSTPFLIEYLKSNQIPIIHLVRLNPYQTAFSEMYAVKSGVWRAENEIDVRTVNAEVDVQELIARARVIQQNMDLVRRWLNGARFLEVIYEEIAGKTYVAAINQVMEFLDLPKQVDFKSAFFKTTPPYKKIVANYEELRPFLS
jgi:LPS sulfotransferase NodH